MVEEKAGRQFQDDLTPARSTIIRADKIEGAELTNAEKRESDQAEERDKMKDDRPLTDQESFLDKKIRSSKFWEKMGSHWRKCARQIKE